MRGLRSSTYVRAESEPLHHARTETFEKDVASVEDPQCDLDSGRLLQIETDRALAAAERVAEGSAQIGPQRSTIDADHVGAHVGQEHPAVRTRRET